MDELAISKPGVVSAVAPRAVGVINGGMSEKPTRPGEAIIGGRKGLVVPSEEGWKLLVSIFHAFFLPPVIFLVAAFFLFLQEGVKGRVGGLWL